LKKYRHYFENMAVRIFLLILKTIPYRVAVWLGGIIGGTLWSAGIRKSVSRRNIELCFPEIQSNEADRILCESYRNFVRSMVEFVLLPKLRGKTLKFVEFERPEVILALIKSQRGALMVTGHFGSWELLGASLAELGLPLDFLVGEQTNHFVDDLINGIRKDMGIGLIHMGVAARGVFKSVRKGRSVAMLSDQDSGKSTIEIDFFGHRAATPGGIGAFALKLKCPIIVGGIVRKNNSVYHRVLTEIIEPDYNSLPESKEEAVKYLTQLYTDRIENLIKKNPEMYFWPHRRFKSTLGYPK